MSDKETSRKPYQLADGRYRVKATVRTVDGKQVQRAFYGATLAEAKRKRSDWQRDEAARDLEPSRVTVAQYLEEWLKSTSAQLKPSSRYSYRYLLESLVVPEIGDLPLQKLTGRTLDKLVTTLMTNDEGKARLTTAARVRSLLVDALDKAVRLGLLARNPMSAVDPVRVPPREIAYWQEPDLKRFLSRTRGSRWHPLYVVAVGTGLRRGELFALRWRDVHASSLTVRENNTPAGGPRDLGTPKTKAGRRRVPFGKTVASAFQEMADRHGREPEGFVFPNLDGTVFHPNNLFKDWKRNVTTAGVPYMHFHGLRHTYASLQIADGIDVRKLAAILGHSRPSITLDTYGHFFEATRQGAALDISALLEDEQGSEQGSNVLREVILTVEDEN
jgi:integrase